MKIRFTFDGRNDTQRSIWAVDNIAIPNPPLNVASAWTYTNAQGQVITINNQQNITVTPDKIGLNTFKITSYLITDDGTECRSADPENSETVSVYVFDKYTSTANATVGTCGQNEFQLNATLSAQDQGNNLSFPTPDGFSAPYWKVEGPTGYSFKNPGLGDTSDPLKNPNAVFVAPNEGTYVLTWAIERNVNDGRSVSSCPPILNTATVVVKNCLALDFDGVDDYVDLGEGYTGDYSIEAWIRPESKKADGTSTNPEATIISGPNFEITIADLPATVVPDTRWYHIAASNGRLYVDGIDVKAFNLRNGSTRAFIGAKWAAPNATNFFSGWIEEVRIWNGNISQDQIKFLMNQRLQNTINIGVEIPMPAPGMAYSGLAGYYQLLATNILNGGYTIDLATSGVNGKLRNMETFQENTAPLPYTSKTDGEWSNRNTWTQPVVWDFPNSTGYDSEPIEWNIVKTNNNIYSGEKDIKVLGLKIESNELKIADPTDAQNWQNSGQSLEVTHYLRLDGSVVLVGESQLLQPLGSILEEASAGFLERDQQGTQSSFNYNYWSSPVSGQGAGSNNAEYSIGSVLKNPLGTLNYVNNAFAADATGKSPTNVVISSYWLYAFKPGTAGEYAEWDHIKEVGTLKSGEGFTMKGTSGKAAIADRQNYTFKGKPHNGPMLGLSIATGQNYLIGNPYPSAIDGFQFIRDNMNNIPGGGNNSSNIFNGSLYFWDHFAGATHYLQEYIGGYAVLNLSGSIEAVSNDYRINDNDSSSTKKPGRFIPVAQGFYINTVPVSGSGINVQGGNVIIDNNQRVYEREIDQNRSIFLSQEKKDKLTSSVDNQQEDTRSKIWIKFKSPKGYHRQLLVTADENTTDDFDLGYDAPLIENNVEDMYWYFNKHGFVIQAVKDFNLERELDLAIKIETAGDLVVSLNELHEIPDEKNIFIRDSLLQVTHDLREGNYVTESEAGIFTDRFKIVFLDKWTVEEPEEPALEEGPVEVIYVNGSREILIKNPELLEISRVYLNNMLGQQVHVYYNIPKDREVPLPVQRFSAGVYAVKVHTEEGIIVKKVILE